MFDFWPHDTGFMSMIRSPLQFPFVLGSDPLICKPLSVWYLPRIHHYGDVPPHNTHPNGPYLVSFLNDGYLKVK